MIVSAYANSPGSDAGLRSSSPGVALRSNRAAAVDHGGTGSYDQALAGAQNTNYLVLVSRIENALRQGELHRQLAERLERILAGRIATLSAVARRHLEELPAFQQLGLSRLSELGHGMNARLADPEQAEATLDLLKHRAFVATMKDQPTATVYGPQGLLRAS